MGPIPEKVFQSLYGLLQRGYTMEGLRDEYRVVETKDGFSLRVNLGDLLGLWIYAVGSWEDGVARVMRETLKPGYTFVDVGAHVGYFTVLGAKLVGSAGRVYAFEPDDVLADQIDKNLERNHLVNCQVRDEALWSEEVRMGFHCAPSGNLGLGSLVKATHGDETIILDTKTLDGELGPEITPALIKVDVEGADLHVLQGAKRILRADRPRVIVEITPDVLLQAGQSAEELCKFMAQQGYVGYGIGEGEEKPGTWRLEKAPEKQVNTLWVPEEEVK